MWQFIISGYLPGTDVQITFETLVTFSLSALFTFVAINWFRRNKTVERQLIALSAKINHIREISL
jgi:hypothetical protein